MPRNPQDIETAMRALIPKTKGHGARALHFVLSHRNEIAVRSMRELAKRASVPPVSLVRLAQKLGFEGFDDFREVYVAALLDGRKSNLDQATQLVTLGKTEGPLEFAMKFADGEFEVLRQTIANLEAPALEAAARDLVTAERIFVIGRRPFYAAAYSFAYSLRKAQPNTHLLDTGGGGELELDGLTKGDLFVGFSTHPYSRVTLGLAENARRQGAKIIAITDSPASPLARLANHSFITLIRSFAFPDSIIGAQLVANILVALTVSRLGRKALDRIEKNELEIRRSGEYVIEAGGRSAKKGKNR